MITHPDQIIAADGVITTNPIRTPKRGKNQNYLNNVHFLVNIADRVNYGKQGVKNPFLLSQLYNFFEEIYVKKLVDLASSVAGRTGGEGGPPPPPVFNIINLESLDEPELSIRKVPRMENTLIALTHELIAKDRIQGLISYQLSSLDKYGCRGLIALRDEPFPDPTRDSDLASIEYKIRMMDLVSDLELGIKAAEEIHLAIVWDDFLDSGVTGYHYLDLENSSCDRVNVTGVDKALRCMASGRDIPVLTISALVKLKESESVPPSQDRRAEALQPVAPTRT